MMKRMIVVVIVLLGLSLGFVSVAYATDAGDLAQVRAATAKYHTLEAAAADGYALIPGLDYCFEKPGVGAMGYHYINPTLLDTSLDANQPEAMVYNRTIGGQLRLGAVEYIVPADAWDSAGNSQPPELLGESLHLNAALGVYVLHAWIWQVNPAGILEDWNPTVSCP